MRNRTLGFGSTVLFVLSLVYPAGVVGQTYTIATVVGYEAQANSMGGPVSVSLGGYGVAIDIAGNLYVVSGDRVLKLSGGIVTTVAGTGTPGSSGDGGPATSAQLDDPFALAVDSSGNLFIADTDNSRVRMVSNGIITTIAGGFGPGTPVAGIQLNSPRGLAVDSAGNVYISDSGNNRVLKLSNGTATTVAGNGNNGFAGDNGPAVSAALSEPYGIAVDSAGNVYISDLNNNRIRKVSNGTITTVAGNGTQGFSGDGGRATSAALSGPTGIVLDSAGDLLIADFNNNRIRRVSNGTITTVAGNGTQGFSGDGGPATSAALAGPDGIAIDSAGNVYFADVNNGRVRVLAVGPGSLGPLTILKTPLPDGVAGQLYAPITMGAFNGLGPYTWSATGLPSGLTMSSGGVLSGTPTLSGKPTDFGTFSVVISVSSGGTTASIALPLTITPNLPKITGGGGGSKVILQAGVVSNSYEATLPVTGGQQPYTWSILGGYLPQGLSLTGSGLYSGFLGGSPNQAGVFTFTAQVTDAVGNSASSIFVLTIGAQPLTLTSLSPLPNAIAGSPYPAQVLTASGGAPPYKFQIAGTLPNGLVLSNGVISGTPISTLSGITGTFSFQVTVTDSSEESASSSFQIAVNPARTDLLLSQAAISLPLTVGLNFDTSQNEVSLPATSTRLTVESNTPSVILNYSVSVSPAVPWLNVLGGGSTPGTINLSLNSQALNLVRDTQTNILVTCIAPSPCAGSAQTINVSVNFANRVSPDLVTNSTLFYSASSAAPKPISQNLELQNTGSGTFIVNSITAADNFVSITGVPGTLQAGPPIPVTVTVNPAGLEAGFHRSTIFVATLTGEPSSSSIPLTLWITPNATMRLAPRGTQFQMSSGGAPSNPAGSFQVVVSGSQAVAWTAALLPGANWLTLSTTSGNSTQANPGTVSFSINSSAASLAPQAYYAAIQVTSPDAADSPRIFVVVLNVGTTASAVPMNPQPSGLVFTASGGATPSAQVVNVYTGSTTPVLYQASADSSWLAVSPATGSALAASPASSSLSVNPSGLAPGVYNGGVSFSASGASLSTVNVTLIVQAGSSTCVPANLVPTETGLVNDFSQSAGLPTPLTVVLVDDCGRPVTNGLVEATFSNGDPALALNAVDTTSGIYSGTWVPGASAQQVSITLSATASGLATASSQISGQVTPNGAAPVLNEDGILNAFAIAAEPGAPLAPGTIVQMYGSNLGSGISEAQSTPLSASLGGTSVFIGGIAAPLYYVSSGQIDAQIPFELPAGKVYEVYVNNNNMLTMPRSIQVTSDAPGIAQFAYGGIIAQHSKDNSLVSETSPAAPGEYVVMYAAGMGLTNQTVPSGSASPSNKLATVLDGATLTLNGARVTNILFAGLTPDLVGLYQVNFQVPANAPNGDLQLVLVQTSGVSNSAVLPVHN